MSINPYSSPLADCSHVTDCDEEYVRRQMRTVIRLYWGMGVFGLVYLTAAALMGIAENWTWYKGSPPPTDFGPLILLPVLATPLAGSIYVGRRLAVRPKGILRLARLVGIVLATVWFPILTIPAVICVRRTTRHFDAYCRLMSADTDRSPPS
ncbi:MAG: hypothetical protein ACYC35_17600 [Pirellulales bacterium]